MGVLPNGGGRPDVLIVRPVRRRVLGLQERDVLILRQGHRVVERIQRGDALTAEYPGLAVHAVVEAFVPASMTVPLSPGAEAPCMTVALRPPTSNALARTFKE